MGVRGGSWGNVFRWKMLFGYFKPVIESMKKAVSKKRMCFVLLTGILLSGTLLSFRYWETEKRISAEFFNTPIAEVLEFFQEETGLRFLYCDEEIRQIPLISRSFKEVSVKRALKQCLRETRYTYSVKRNLLLIRPKR